MPKTPPPPLPPQLPDEPDLAYSLFAEYCQLGPKRSIRALSELVKRSRPVLGALSVRWQWPDRAAAWDRAHAIAPDPGQDRVDALGDRKARIAVALDAAIGLISDKLQSADPIETPARSITGLVSALATCLEMHEALEPQPLMRELEAIEVLLPSVDPRLAGRLAEQMKSVVETFAGNLDAALATNFLDDPIDVEPHS